MQDELYLCLIKRPATNMYGGIETLLHAFLNSALDGVTRDCFPRKLSPAGDSVGLGRTFWRMRLLQPAAWRGADHPQDRGGLQCRERVEIIPCLNILQRT
jgi:hypothetical protein